MPSTNRTRVALVDDHVIVRDGLRQLLELSGDFEVVGQAADGVEAVNVAKSLTPDVVLMDVIMPGRDGVEACREIMDILPDTRVLCLRPRPNKTPLYSLSQPAPLGTCRNSPEERN